MKDEILLRVRDLAVEFRSKGTLHALRGVSLEVRRGECVALVGESGSGKTTLARAILRLTEAARGEVFFKGENVLEMDRRQLLAYRRRAQMVFQDPFGSLNPRLRAGSVLAEVLRVHGRKRTASEVRSRVEELLGLVGLHASHADRFPHEFSGGQRQRLGIARALAVDPELLILDEPVTALDLSVQAQILNLLADLRERLALTLLLVAHDLSVVRHLADRVAVLYLGQMVETAPVAALFEDPRHPYTRGLMAAADSAPEEASGGQLWTLLSGDPPSPLTPPSGCSFHPRCPHPGKDRRCREEAPPWAVVREVRGVSCWLEL